MTRWKTGFLRIARGAQVPVLLVGLEFPARVLHVGTLLTPGPDLDADLARVKRLLQGLRGKRPARQ